MHYCNCHYILLVIVAISSLLIILRAMMVPKHGRVSLGTLLTEETPTVSGDVVKGETGEGGLLQT